MAIFVAGRWNVMITGHDCGPGIFELDPRCDFKNESLIALMEKWNRASRIDIVPRHNTVERLALELMPESTTIGVGIKSTSEGFDAEISYVGKIIAAFHGITVGMKVSENPDRLARVRTMIHYGTIATLGSCATFLVCRPLLKGGTDITIERGVFPLAEDGKTVDLVVVCEIIKGADQ